MHDVQSCWVDELLVCKAQLEMDSVYVFNRLNSLVRKSAKRLAKGSKTELILNL